MTKLRKNLRISSRKITRVIGRRSMQKEDAIIDNAIAFQLEINDRIATEHLRDRSVWNADQSGFEYEPIRNRTLTHKGEKIVEARVADSKAVSHSYTIQVHISKEGKLGKHIFICLQEVTGNSFGPKVQETLSRLLSSCQNVKLSCSKSGKFTTAIMQQWFNEVFLEDVEDRSLLLLDAWPGQGPTAGLDSPGVSIAYIPQGATKYIQPLDVYFFRQYKLLVKNVVESCRDSYFGDESNAKPSNRNFIIRLHSLCYNQLQHPRFSNMLRYAWKKSGYVLDEDVASFENVIEILLEPLRHRDAKCTTHAIIALMKCVYCDHYICLSCFSDPIHLHNQF